MKQYIDFFHSNGQNFCNEAPVAMNAARQQCLSNILNATFPKRGDEDYELTDVATLFAPDYGISHTPSADAQYHELRADGTFIGSFHHAPQGILEKYYGSVCDMQMPQVALNTLFAVEGILLYVPKNVQVAEPVHIHSLLSTDMLLASPRILIVAEEGAKVSVTLAQNSSMNLSGQCLTNSVVEVVCGRNSDVEIYDIEKTHSAATRTNALFAKQAEGSSLMVQNITLDNGITRNDVIVTVDGEHCETVINGIALGNGTRSIDNHTYIRHNYGHCRSNELFKYLVDESARGAFSGRIYVSKGADKIEAMQSNKNIVATSEARMFTKPQLEIYNDDVKCSHGATIGQLDQNALFYMRTRGISEHEARTLLIQAFMSDVISTIRNEQLRAKIEALVTNQLSSSRAKCNTCTAKCN